MTSARYAGWLPTVLILAPMPPPPLPLARERGAEGGVRPLFPRAAALGYVLSPLTGLRNGWTQGEDFIPELLTQNTILRMSAVSFQRSTAARAES